VGHSLGALYADLFARLHTREVAGVVKLAPADPRHVPALDEESIARSLGKMQPQPEQAFRENLRAEVAAIGHLAEEIANAGAFPDVPLVVVEGQGGHFPQLNEPGQVLDAIERVVRRSRRGTSTSRVPQG
jgi:pimeloyl-ACP methyl ester carboxylesterase